MHQTIICILAGGQSLRFGKSKLEVRIDDAPILTYQLHKSRQVLYDLGVTGQVWLSHSSTTPQPPGANGFDRWIADPYSFAGPLQAMHHVLANTCEDDVVFFVAADMPGTSAEYFARLWKALHRPEDRSGSAYPIFHRSQLNVGEQSKQSESTHVAPSGILGRWTGGPRPGDVEPLPSIWRSGAARRSIGHALSCGVNAPSRLALRQDIALEPLLWPNDRNCFVNINRPDDLAEASSLLAATVTAH